MIDPLEADMLAGAVTALRRRAERQRKRAADWTVTTENGVIIKSGEGAIAERIAETLEALAGEFEGEGHACPLAS